MRELQALTARLLRSTLRSRMAAATGLLFALGLGAATWLGAGETDAGGIFLLGGLTLVAFLVTGAAVGAGAVLPEDRVAGREEWLSTLAPPAWKRRLAALLAGWTLALALGLGGGLLVGGVSALVRPDLRLLSYEPIVLPAESVSRGAEHPIRIELSERDTGGKRVEVDVRPRFDFYRHGSPVDRLQLEWRAGSAGGAREIAARGSVRFDVPADASVLELTSLTQGVQLRVLAARRLGASHAPAAGLAWAGLLLGLLAGSVAPIAVLLSRRTTGQTAAAAAFSLLLLGAARGPLLEIADRLEPEGWMQAAPALLQGLAWLAPEVGLFSLFEQVANGRLPYGFPLAVLLYTLVVALLACLPLPRRLREGANA